MKSNKKGQCPNCDTLIDFDDIEPLSSVQCPNCGTSLVIPWVFHKYLLTEQENIEHNCFNFYLGYDPKSNEKIRAILLKQNILDYDNWLEFCKVEVSSLKTVEHDNIVPIIDYGMFGGHFFVIEPWIEGFSIKEYDPNIVGELEVQSVIKFSKKVALGIDAIHHKEFTHHNICPENIFVDSEGNVKIINLFVSRFEYFFDKKIRRNTFNVSPYYISPEKAEKYKEDKKGDIFSFGVFVYYFLTGRYPFNGNNEEEIIYSRIKRKKARDQVIVKADYVEPDHIKLFRGEEIRDKVDEIILRLMKPYPIQRPFAGEYISELKLVDVEEIKALSAKRRKNLLDLAETVKIPKMEKLSK